MLFILMYAVNYLTFQDILVTYIAIYEAKIYRNVKENQNSI